VPFSCVFASVLVGFRLSSTAWQAALAFVLLMSEVGTYAMVGALLSAPYAFAYGCLAAGYVLLISRYETPRAGSAAQLRDTGKLSLTLGVLSLILAFIPAVGLVLGVLAVFHGVRTKEGYGQAVARPTSARIGAALGALCIFWWLFAFAVYLASGRGWLKQHARAADFSCGSGWATRYASAGSTASAAPPIRSPIRALPTMRQET
jgi:hypothetical protein